MKNSHSSDDLKNYKAVERPVLRGSYRGYQIVSMPPSDSATVMSGNFLSTGLKTRSAAACRDAFPGNSWWALGPP